MLSFTYSKKQGDRRESFTSLLKPIVRPSSVLSLQTKIFEYFRGRNFRGRKFCSFVIFWPIRKSLFRKMFRTETSAKVYSREIQESRIIYDAASKND